MKTIFIIMLQMKLFVKPPIWYSGTEEVAATKRWEKLEMGSNSRPTEVS
jgi:hypothetical protein